MESFELTTEEMFEAFDPVEDVEHQCNNIAQAAQRKLWKDWLNQACLDETHEGGFLRLECPACWQRLDAALGGK